MFTAVADGPWKEGYKKGRKKTEGKEEGESGKVGNRKDGFLLPSPHPVCCLSPSPLSTEIFVSQKCPFLLECHCVGIMHCRLKLIKIACMSMDRVLFPWK